MILGWYGPQKDPLTPREPEIVQIKRDGFGSRTRRENRGKMEVVLHVLESLPCPEVELR